MVKCPHCGEEFNQKLKCTRCKHEWYPKDPSRLPEVCPKCKSPYWDRERVREMKKKSTGNDGVGGESRKI